MANNRKVIGYSTTFPILGWYRKLAQGEITLEEFSEIEDVEPITEPIYEDEVE